MPVYGVRFVGIYELRTLWIFPTIGCEMLRDGLFIDFACRDGRKTSIPEKLMLAADRRCLHFLKKSNNK